MDSFTNIGVLFTATVNLAVGNSISEVSIIL